MIKAVVFDCFGVLAEDGWLPFKRKFIGDDNDLAAQAADLGKQNEYGMISNEEYFEAVAELIGANKEQLKGALGKRLPNEELFEFIDSELKPKYKIGLLSNANYDVLHELFTPEHAKMFDATVMSFQDKLIKPDPKMFRLMADRLGTELNEYIFVDDIERYCVAAEELGIASVLYENPTQAKRDSLQLLQG